MPFTTRGTEYSKIEGGLATGMLPPWGGKLRKLRKELAGEAVRDSERRQAQAESMANRPAPRPAVAPQTPAEISPIEQERKRRKMIRMGLLRAD
ncbi:MAG: hypothetical protein MIO92_16460 [Methanosarcinaceae archaeon]|nr:hypothetical protein [Methanosarcinaceae archaeon]